MKVPGKLTIPILLLSALSSILSSCKKENKETDYNPNLVAAQCHVRANQVYADIFSMMHKAFLDTTLIRHGHAIIDTADVTFDTLPTLRIHVGYGDFFRMCPDGRVRRGGYIAGLSKWPGDSGCIANIRFLDHYVQDMKVEGHQAIAFLGMISPGIPGYQYTVDSARITLLNDTTPTGSFSWKCFFENYQTEGKGTMITADDIFVQEGNSSGVDLNGKAFSTATLTGHELVYDFNCPWFYSGMESFQTPGLEISEGQVDYGYESGCNRRVYFFFNGNPFFYDAN